MDHVALTGPSLEDRALAVFCDDLEASIRAAGDQPTEPLSTVRARCQSSLRAFIEEVWPVVEPQTPFVGNWHIDALCAHLEAVTRGELRNLLINIPPGCMKSYIVSVMWPAWEWTQRPHSRYLCVSYDQNLSTRDNLRCRRIVESDRYRALFPHVVLAADQNQKTRYDTQQGGWRIGASVGAGRVTGEHPHRKIIDDPISVDDARSDVERQRVIDHFDETLSSRGKALHAATVIIMQRLHQHDLSAHVLERHRATYTHLCLPMQYEPPQPPTPGESPVPRIVCRQSNGDQMRL